MKINTTALTALLALTLVACDTDDDTLSPDAHPDAQLEPCPGESLYPALATGATCSVLDIRAGTSTLPEQTWGTFPFPVEPSPHGPGFVLIRRVFTDPFIGGEPLPGTYYTLDAGCGAGGALLNGCAFSICVDEVAQ